MAKPLAVDFTGVESREILPVGDYAVEVVKIEQKDGSKGTYLNWEMRVCTGQFAGKKLWMITSLSQNSLWVLRNVLLALGVKTQAAKMSLNLDSLVGLKMGVRVKHSTFEGKTKAKVEETFPLDELQIDNPIPESSDEDEADEEN